MRVSNAKEIIASLLLSQLEQREGSKLFDGGGEKPLAWMTLERAQNALIGTLCNIDGSTRRKERRFPC